MPIVGLMANCFSKVTIGIVIISPNIQAAADNDVEINIVCQLALLRIFCETNSASFCCCDGLRPKYHQTIQPIKGIYKPVNGQMIFITATGCGWRKRSFKIIRAVQTPRTRKGNANWFNIVSSAKFPTYMRQCA